MKQKTFIVALLSGLILQPWAFAQTNGMETNQPAPAEMAATNPPVIAPATNADAGVVVTNPPAASNETPVVSSNNPAVAVAAPPIEQPGTIPLIQFQDVPLTTAIENLARQANINYLLDPKIGYGQPDANGQIKTEPTLSIRWENITAEQALVALLDNYSLQIVQDSKTKIARVTTKDPSAPPALVTRVVQLKYASTTNMVDSIQAALTDKRSKVLPDTRTSQLVVVATDREQEAVDTLVMQLDKPTRQVLIETRLVEISSSPSTSKGINWSGTLAAQNIGFGNNVSQGGRYSHTATLGDTNLANYGFSPILQTFGAPQLLSQPSLLVDTAKGFNPTTAFLDADGVKAVLSFINSSSDAQVVSTPRVVTLDNESATISVTRAFPVFNITAGTQGSPGGSSVAYSNVGTILQVTPRISANDYIWLKVVPEVSSLFGKDTETIAGTTYTADIFDYRTVQTQVLIPNANTLVMGGLVKDNPATSNTKIPFLGDIPVLGYAFRSENKSLDKDNLLIFITPTIVKDADFQPTTTDFLNTRPKYKKPPLDANTAWEGAKPHDWSNPKNTDPDQALINQTAD